MKNIILLLLFTVFISCSKNDNPVKTNPLNSQWNLIKVTCECQTINLEIGEHVWTFNTSESKLYVQNNVTEQLHTILETGTYDISISGDKITILTVEYDYYFENGTLFLADQPEADGPLIKFIEN